MTIRFDDTGESLIVYLPKRVDDEGTIVALGERLIELCELAAANGQPMVLDFDGVESASSALIGKLVLLNKRSKQTKVKLTLRQLPACIRDLLSITRLNRVFEIEGEERSACVENKYTESARVVHKYYRRLVSTIADTVLERRLDFENPMLRNVDEFFDEQARMLYAVAIVYENLKARSPAAADPAVQRVKQFVVTEESTEEQLNEWLRENPEIVVSSIACHEVNGRQICIVAYREGDSCG